MTAGDEVLKKSYGQLKIVPQKHNVGEKVAYSIVDTFVYCLKFYK